jgi:hypothetical protein
MEKIEEMQSSLMRIIVAILIVIRYGPDILKGNGQRKRYARHI